VDSIAYSHELAQNRLFHPPIGQDGLVTAAGERASIIRARNGIIVVSFVWFTAGPSRHPEPKDIPAGNTRTPPLLATA
jgi:hypothetical protein